VLTGPPAIGRRPCWQAPRRRGTVVERKLQASRQSQEQSKENISEGSIASGEATVIFFGTSSCWNTSHEAARLVRLYPRFRNRIHFVIVDLNNVAPAQQAFVSQYYHGYIPSITAIDSRGALIYDRAGETASTRGDRSNLQRLLDSVH
jgi:hypothetical protein